MPSKLSSTARVDAVVCGVLRLRLRAMSRLSNAASLTRRSASSGASPHVTAYGDEIRDSPPAETNSCRCEVAATHVDGFSATHMD
eukprot:6182945-Pleurochrysis_carterae.AAC.2